MIDLPDGYEVADDEARIAVGYLVGLKERLGIPDDAVLDKNNKLIISYALEIYRVWAALFPDEHKEFIKNTEFELKYERPVKEAIKAGGYSPIAYPTRLDQMFHLLLPKIKVQSRTFWEPLLKSIPELKRTNYFK